LTIDDSTLSDNKADENATENNLDMEGGGIFNAGTLTASNSTFFGNSAIEGGGIAIDANNTTTIRNSTIYGNSAGGDYYLASAALSTCLLGLTSSWRTASSPATVSATYSLV
jgi:hypothetical protein